LKKKKRKIKKKKKYETTKKKIKKNGNEIGRAGVVGDDAQGTAHHRP